MKWCPISSSLPTHPFAGNHWAFWGFVNLQMVCDHWCIRSFTILYFDRYRARCTTRAELPKPAASVPRSPQAFAKAFRKERENIEDGGFTASVGANEYGQGRDSVDDDFPQCAVVLHTKGLDPWHGSHLDLTSFHASPFSQADKVPGRPYRGIEPALQPPRYCRAGPGVAVMTRGCWLRGAGDNRHTGDRWRGMRVAWKIRPGHLWPNQRLCRRAGSA
jgi:hypothetical protein